jgi:hypothetical protein
MICGLTVEPESEIMISKLTEKPEIMVRDPSLINISYLILLLNVGSYEAWTPDTDTDTD